MPAGEPARHARILLTDDNAVNRQVIKLFLAPLGVASPRRRMAGRRSTGWRAEPFDLVLLDMHMPVMDGPQTIEAHPRAREPLARRFR